MTLLMLELKGESTFSVSEKFYMVFRVLGFALHISEGWGYCSSWRLLINGEEYWEDS